MLCKHQFAGGRADDFVRERELARCDENAGQLQDSGWLMQQRSYSGQSFGSKHGRPGLRPKTVKIAAPPITRKNGIHKLALKPTFATFCLFIIATDPSKHLQNEGGNFGMSLLPSVGGPAAGRFVSRKSAAW